MIYDKDFSDKIKKFENIKSIINACKDEIIKDGEEYYLIARSNVKVKTKVR